SSESLPGFPSAPRVGRARPPASDPPTCHPPPPGTAPPPKKTGSTVPPHPIPPWALGAPKRNLPPSRPRAEPPPKSPAEPARTSARNVGARYSATSNELDVSSSQSLAPCTYSEASYQPGDTSSGRRNESVSEPNAFVTSVVSRSVAFHSCQRAPLPASVRRA